MNLFEDLVEELKDEHLLEETVIETSESEYQANLVSSSQANLNRETTQNELSVEIPPRSANSIPNIEAEMSRKFGVDIDIEAEMSRKFDVAIDNDLSTGFVMLNDSLAEPMLIKDEEIIEDQQAQKKQAVNESEFYRRRATEEVSSLKIVEHVLSGVEREHMKIFPKTYDDMSVSKALHDFLKITEETQSPEHAQAEFKLMQETESWYSSLSYRDKHISVGDLRRYCETSRPPLSSQALVSLARFYRNSPFSESVRSKFDMVVTKLLSKEIKVDKRVVQFGKEELIEQLVGLYSDWSSIPLYASDDDPEVLIAALKFDDFVREARNAGSFEELIKNDFFNRLRIFKESTGENFFAPLLTATAIESNIEIGNFYVDLVAKERQKTTVAELEEKYKYLVDQVVSDTTSKTLQLVELLKEKKAEPKPEINNVVEEKEVIHIEDDKEKSIKFEQRSKSSFFKINKWIIALAVFTFLFCGSLYVYVEYLTPQIKPSPSVKAVNLDNSSLKEFYKTAKINKETFFAITGPAWETLSKESKEDVLRKTLEVGSEKGYNKVHLINSEGKTVGFASEKGIDLTQQ